MPEKYEDKNNDLEDMISNSEEETTENTESGFDFQEFVVKVQDKIDIYYPIVERNVRKYSKKAYATVKKYLPTVLKGYHKIYDPTANRFRILGASKQFQEFDKHVKDKLVDVPDLQTIMDDSNNKKAKKVKKVRLTKKDKEPEQVSEEPKIGLIASLLKDQSNGAKAVIIGVLLVLLVVVFFLEVTAFLAPFTGSEKSYSIGVVVLAINIGTILWGLFAGDNYGATRYTIFSDFFGLMFKTGLSNAEIFDIALKYVDYLADCQNKLNIRFNLDSEMLMYEPQENANLDYNDYVPMIFELPIGQYEILLNEVSNSNDYMLKNLGLIPNIRGSKVYYHDRFLTFSFDDFLITRVLGKTRKDFKLDDLKQIYTDLDTNYSFSDRKALQNDNKLKDLGFSKKAINIFRILEERVEDFGIKPLPASDKYHRNTEYAVEIHAELVNGTTQRTLSRIAEQLGAVKGIGITPITRKSRNDSETILRFQYPTQVAGRKVKYTQMLKEANEGIINIGSTSEGDFVVQYPRGDDPFFVLIGGISRSGKSTFATRLITQALLLNDGNGFYDYDHVFIGSKKVKDDYKTPLGWHKLGMYLTSDALDQYEMLNKIDKYMTDRANIISGAGCVNIAEFNKKHKDNKLGKVLLVMDEYKNTQTEAEEIKIETDAGKKKLNELIESRLVSMASLHGSRGLNIIVMTQSFAKNSVGRVRDTLGSQFLGYADKDVWNSIDTSQEVSSYLKDKKGKRKGLFMVKAPDFEPVDPNSYFTEYAGFVEVKTHYHDKDDLVVNFDRTYETGKVFLSPDYLLEQQQVQEEQEEEIPEMPAMSTTSEPTELAQEETKKPEILESQEPLVTVNDTEQTPDLINNLLDLEDSEEDISEEILEQQSEEPEQKEPLEVPKEQESEKLSFDFSNFDIDL